MDAETRRRMKAHATPRMILLVALFVGFNSASHAQVAKSNAPISMKDGLKEMLQANGAKSLKKLTVSASDDQAAELTRTRGVSLEGAYTVYNGIDGDGKVMGSVVQINEDGKEGPLQVLVAFKPTGEVYDIGFTVFGEDRGKPALSYPFLKQFIGKSTEETMILGKGVDGISGATWTSNSVSSAVRKAVVVYDVFVKDTVSGG